MVSDQSYAFVSPAGTTMGGGLGAIMWDAAGGMGTTLMRGACTMGGIGVSTWPGARRTTGAIGGRGITGTADSRVVRTWGGTCNAKTEDLMNLMMTKFEKTLLKTPVCTDSRWGFGHSADGWVGFGNAGHCGRQWWQRQLVGFAGANLLLVVILLHQTLGFVDGLDLLLQGDVGLGGLLSSSHTARVTIPRHLLSEIMKD